MKTIKTVQDANVATEEILDEILKDQSERISMFVAGNIFQRSEELSALFNGLKKGINNIKSPKFIYGTRKTKGKLCKHSTAYREYLYECFKTVDATNMAFYTILETINISKLKDLELTNIISHYADLLFSTKTYKTKTDFKDHKRRKKIIGGETINKSKDAGHLIVHMMRELCKDLDIITFDKIGVFTYKIEASNELEEILKDVYIKECSYVFPLPHSTTVPIINIVSEFLKCENNCCLTDEIDDEFKEIYQKQTSYSFNWIGDKYLEEAGGRWAKDRIITAMSISQRYNYENGIRYTANLSDTGGFDLVDNIYLPAIRLKQGQDKTSLITTRDGTPLHHYTKNEYNLYALFALAGIDMRTSTRVVNELVMDIMNNRYVKECKALDKLTPNDFLISCKFYTSMGFSAARECLIRIIDRRRKQFECSYFLDDNFERAMESIKSLMQSTLDLYLKNAITLIKEDIYNSIDENKKAITVEYNDLKINLYKYKKKQFLVRINGKPIKANFALPKNRKLKKEAIAKFGIWGLSSVVVNSIYRKFYLENNSPILINYNNIICEDSTYERFDKYIKDKLFNESATHEYRTTIFRAS